jgi:hypothetical protein
MKVKTEKKLDDSIDSTHDDKEYDIDYFSDENDDAFEEDFIDQKDGLSAEEQMKLQKKAVVKYRELDKSQIVDNFRTFVLKEYPQIINGFDRSIYGHAKHAYWREENLFELWLVPLKIYNRIKEAEVEVENKLRDDAQEYADKMFPTWYENYITWLSKNELKKSTKANVKDFFKSIKVKPTETMIERVKEKHSNNT